MRRKNSFVLGLGKRLFSGSVTVAALLLCVVVVRAVSSEAGSAEQSWNVSPLPGRKKQSIAQLREGLFKPVLAAYGFFP